MFCSPCVDHRYSRWAIQITAAPRALPKYSYRSCINWNKWPPAFSRSPIPVQMQPAGYFSPSKDCIRIASTWMQCVVCGSQIIMDLRVPQHSFTRQTITALIFPFQQLQYPGTMGWVKVKDVVSASTWNVLAWVAPSQILNIILMSFFFFVLCLHTFKNRAGVTHVTAVHTFEGQWINTGFMLQEEIFCRTQSTSWWGVWLVDEIGSWCTELPPLILMELGWFISAEDLALCSCLNSELFSGYSSYIFVCIELSISSHPFHTSCLSRFRV